jgi:hypothetical protein
MLRRVSCRVDVGTDLGSDYDDYNIDARGKVKTPSQSPGGSSIVWRMQVTFERSITGLYYGRYDREPKVAYV